MFFSQVYRKALDFYNPYDDGLQAVGHETDAISFWRRLFAGYRGWKKQCLSQLKWFWTNICTN